MIEATTWTRKSMTSLVEGLETAAGLFPNKKAIHYRVWHPQGKNKEVKVDDWQTCTFGELWARVITLSERVLKYHAKPGDRALIFWIPPSQMDALAMFFGLMKAGIVVVWLDPRTMTFAQLLSNIESVGPRILFADKWVRRIVRGVQLTKRRLHCIKVYIGSREMHGLAPIPKVTSKTDKQDVVDMDGGAIMFTTGSTGVPKPVRLTSSCLAGQCDAYEQAAKDIGLGGPGQFIAIHTGMNFNALDLALGNTTVMLPDPANPGRINPKWIEEADEMFHPSIMTASRVVYENLARASESRSDQSKPYLPSLRLAFSGGAPVTPALHDRVCKALPSLKDFYSAYGCTEGLPLMLSGWNSTWQGSLDSEMTNKSKQQGLGIMLGDLCPHVEIFILRLDKLKEIETKATESREVQVWNEEEWACKTDEMGELIIRSPSVSPHYVNLPLANATSKFKHPSGDPPMHRTGDLVTKDADGNVWMLGRIAQAVKLPENRVVPPVCIESIFDGTGEVNRSAFVGVSPAPLKKQKKSQTPIVVPVLVILRKKESKTQPFSERSYVERIKNTDKWGFVADCGLRILEYTVDEEFPMDGRHNSKIRREILAKWAEKLL